MKKKIVLILIILIVVLVATGFLVTRDNSKSIKKGIETVLYVGGTGECNYSSIQAALDDAGENYTIFIYPGTYCEHLVISKSVCLFGKDTAGRVSDLSNVPFPSSVKRRSLT